MSHGKRDMIPSPTGKYLSKSRDVRLRTGCGNSPANISEIQQKWIAKETFRKGEIGRLHGFADQT